MNLVTRLAALEQRTPRPAPSDDRPWRLAFQVKPPITAADHEQMRELAGSLADEVRQTCAAHPVAIVMAGDVEPAPTVCMGCSGFSVTIVMETP